MKEFAASRSGNALQVILGVIVVLGLCLLVMKVFFGLDLSFFGRPASAVKQPVAVANTEEAAKAIEEIKKEYDDKTGDYPEDQKITVRGRIITEDGGKLPTRTCKNCRNELSEYVDVNFMVSGANHNTALSVWKNGEFEFTTRHRQFYISVMPRKKYAAAHFGPFEYDAGQVVEGLELKLKKGFPAKIEFVDPDGKPAAYTKVVGGYPAPPNYGSYTHSVNIVTDADGIALIENAADIPLTLRVEAPGFVKETREKIQLSPDEPYIWKLTPAKPVNLTVISDTDESPILCAAIHISGRAFYGFGSGNKENSEYQTDKDGKISLSSLAENEVYRLLIVAEGYKRQFVDVSAGQDVVVRMKKFVPITGKITGDLSRLSSDEHGSYIEFGNSYQVSASSWHSDWTGSNKVTVKPVNENEATFEIDRYYGHRITIAAGGKRHSVNIDQDDLSNVVIDIPAPESYEKKKFVLNFVHADGSTDKPINGKLKLSYKDPGEDFTEAHEVEIVDGKVEVEITLPNYVDWKPVKGGSIYFCGEYKRLPADYSGSETVKCYPAGAIYGKILNPGRVLNNASMGIDVVKKPEYIKKALNLYNLTQNSGDITLDPDGSYYLSPVPLGGTYGISVSGGNLLCTGSEVTLTEEKPIWQMDITLPEKLVDIHGRIIDPDGKPVSGAGYNIDKKAGFAGGGYSNDSWRTGSDGSFTIDGVSPDDSIEYGICFDAHGFVKRGYGLKLAGENEIVLERALKVSGVVLDKETKKPISGVRVSFWPGYAGGSQAGIRSFETKTDSKGRFTADQFADLEYSYYLNKERYQFRTSKSINPAKEKEVEFYMKPDPRWK